MNTTVTRGSAPARKPNRRRGAVPSRPDSPVVQLADQAAAKRGAQWTAAYRRETARTGRWPARTAT